MLLHVIPIEKPSNEAKAEIQIYPVIVEANIIELYCIFCAFYSSIHFSLYL